MRLLLLSGLGVLALAACAPTASEGEAGGARPERQCFNADQIQNFRAPSYTSLYIRALGGDVYELQTSAGCNDLPSAMGIALNPGMGGINRVCVGDWTDVAVRSSGSTPSPCRARIARKLTDAEVEALPARSKP